MSAILGARAVSLAVGRARLVDGVDLDIAGGEMVAIVGPNGAGKSTLLRMLSGDLRPTAGSVALGSRDIRSWSPRELAERRAMLSQHVHVTFPFTVEEIVGMGTGGRSRAALNPVIEQALQEVGLGRFRDRQLPTLSGGEQQRAHFARVLVQLACGEAMNGPGLLLLDEPTSSLDLRHQIDLVESARRRAERGTAVVAILHDLNLAMRFADRIALLHRGRLAALGDRRTTITSERIRELFEVDVAIRHTDDGVPYLLPQTMQPAAPAPR
ncbi:heme ABC transporter ATP-binding protein [Bradyrhizobium sp.]|uniref:heme ABC transporter ATP-binding protein n=1 Tax=Bradyrhizobium sp. TaxID=376 RepID=UPI004037FEEE